MKKLLTTLSILFIATASYAQTYHFEEVIDCRTIIVNEGEEAGSEMIFIFEENKMPIYQGTGVYKDINEIIYK